MHRRKLSLRLTRRDLMLVCARILMKLSRLILVLAATFCFGLPLRAQPKLADGVKAIVNDSVITFAEVEDFAGPAIDSLRRQYAGQPDVFEQKLTDVLTNSLEILVERQLILHDFDAEGYKLPDSVLDEYVQDNIHENFGDRATFMKTMQARGETFEKYREELRDQYIETAMRRKNVTQEIVISPFKIESYYLAHQDDFKIEDEIKLHMIVLNKSSPGDTNTLKLAGEVLTKIKEGATFAEMASVYSQGSQQHPGGDWGWVGRSVLRKELDAAAFALKPGQASEVIETPEACYIMLVDDRRVAHVKTLGEVRDDIEKNLRAQQQSQLEKQWIEQLKKKAFIRIIP
jgi:peptidyl-prolyl cis-trans isomerase SurA